MSHLGGESLVTGLDDSESAPSNLCPHGQPVDMGDRSAYDTLVLC